MSPFGGGQFLLEALDPSTQPADLQLLLVDSRGLGRVLLAELRDDLAETGDCFLDLDDRDAPLTGLGFAAVLDPLHDEAAEATTTEDGDDRKDNNKPRGQTAEPVHKLPRPYELVDQVPDSRTFTPAAAGGT